MYMRWKIHSEVQFLKPLLANITATRSLKTGVTDIFICTAPMRKYSSA